MNKKWIKWLGIACTALIAGVTDWENMKKDEKLEELEYRIAELEGDKDDVDE